MNSFFVSAQTRSQQLSENFDTILYHDDSSIAMVGHLHKNKLCGYAIEFDYKFRPLWLGEYNSGMKNGTWISSLGCWENYYEGESGGIVCANHFTGDSMKKSFYRQYAKLTGIYTNYNHVHILKEEFDTLLYFNDSVLREVAMMKDHKKHGPAIVFDSLGNPSEIGQYEKGIRIGNWREIQGCVHKYRKGKIVSGGCSGCGYQWNKMRIDFYQRYKELTGIDLLHIIDF